MPVLKKSIIFLIACVTCLAYRSDAQFLKKLKEKINDATKSNSSQTTNNAASPGSKSGGSSGSPSNTRGGGLTNTAPPDVNNEIANAEKSQSAKNYSDARYSLQQALMSIELQIGRQVLQSLPATVSGLQKDTTQNKVMSTQWGWNNLTIQSVYKKNDQQLTVTIGNNSVYSGFVNLYFNSAYVQSSNDGKQNVKQTRVKSYKALITFDESKGYTLLVPLGQSSMIVWECINFASEQDVMNAANAFDIDGIKTMLGEK
jgi:hypothetical protein